MAVGRSQAAVLIAPRPKAKFIIAASSAMGISYLQGAETDSAVSQPLANLDARVVSQAAVCSASCKIVRKSTILRSLGDWLERLRAKVDYFVD